MYLLDELSLAEQHEFFKFPVYLCLLAANQDSFLADDDEESRPVADQIKTYNCHPVLNAVYKQASSVFQPNLELLDNQLPKGKLERDVAIKIELRKIKELLRKLDPAFATIMHQSMKSFKEHVSESNEHALDDFLFPIPIKGLTDQ